MMLSVTAAARAAGVSRTTVYDKINSGELSRTREGIDTSELMRVFGALKTTDAPAASTTAGEGEGMTTWLRDQLTEAQTELRQTRSDLEDVNADLADTRQRLDERRAATMQLEHREAKMLLEHGEEKRLLEEKHTQAEQQVKKVLGDLRELQSRNWFARLVNWKPPVT